DRHHLVERGGDQAGQPDHVGLFFARGVENGLEGNHDAEVDDLVVVAAQHHADDVFADVVHVALHGGDHDGAVVFHRPAALGLDERNQVRHRLLHDACALHHLGEKHFTAAEQVTHHVHAI